MHDAPFSIMQYIKGCEGLLKSPFSIMQYIEGCKGLLKSPFSIMQDIEGWEGLMKSPFSIMQDIEGCEGLLKSPFSVSCIWSVARGSRSSLSAGSTQSDARCSSSPAFLREYIVTRGGVQK